MIEATVGNIGLAPTVGLSGGAVVDLFRAAPLGTPLILGYFIDFFQVLYDALKWVFLLVIQGWVVTLMEMFVIGMEQFLFIRDPSSMQSLQPLFETVEKIFYMLLVPIVLSGIALRIVYPLEEKWNIDRIMIRAGFMIIAFNVFHEFLGIAIILTNTIIKELFPGTGFGMSFVSLTAVRAIYSIPSILGRFTLANILGPGMLLTSFILYGVLALRMVFVLSVAALAGIFFPLMIVDFGIVGYFARWGKRLISATFVLLFIGIIIAGVLAVGAAIGGTGPQTVTGATDPVGGNGLATVPGANSSALGGNGTAAPIGSTNQSVQPNSVGLGSQSTTGTSNSSTSAAGSTGGGGSSSSATGSSGQARNWRTRQASHLMRVFFLGASLYLVIIITMMSFPIAMSTAVLSGTKRAMSRGLARSTAIAGGTISQRRRQYPGHWPGSDYVKNGQGSTSSHEISTNSGVDTPSTGGDSSVPSDATVVETTDGFYHTSEEIDPKQLRESVNEGEENIPDPDALPKQFEPVETDTPGESSIPGERSKRDRLLEKDISGLQRGIAVGKTVGRLTYRVRREQLGVLMTPPDRSAHRSGVMYQRVRQTLREEVARHKSPPGEPDTEIDRHPPIIGPTGQMGEIEGTPADETVSSEGTGGGSNPEAGQPSPISMPPNLSGQNGDAVATGGRGKISLPGRSDAATQESKQETIELPGHSDAGDQSVSVDDSSGSAASATGTIDTDTASTNEPRTQGEIALPGVAASEDGRETPTAATPADTERDEGPGEAEPSPPDESQPETIDLPGIGVKSDLGGDQHEADTSNADAVPPSGSEGRAETPKVDQEPETIRVPREADGSIAHTRKDTPEADYGSVDPSVFRAFDAAAPENPSVPETGEESVLEEQESAGSAGTHVDQDGSSMEGPTTQDATDEGFPTVGSAENSSADTVTPSDEISIGTWVSDLEDEDRGPALIVNELDQTAEATEIPELQSTVAAENESYPASDRVVEVVFRSSADYHLDDDWTADDILDLAESGELTETRLRTYKYPISRVESFLD